MMLAARARAGCSSFLIDRTKDDPSGADVPNLPRARHRLRISPSRSAVGDAIILARDSFGRLRQRGREKFTYNTTKITLSAKCAAFSNLAAPGGGAGAQPRIRKSKQEEEVISPPKQNAAGLVEHGVRSFVLWAANVGCERPIRANRPSRLLEN